MQAQKTMKRKNETRMDLSKRPNHISKHEMRFQSGATWCQFWTVHLHHTKPFILNVIVFNFGVKKLPLKKAWSSIYWSRRDSGWMRPLLYPPMDATPFPPAINQERTTVNPPWICHPHDAPPPHGKCHPPPWCATPYTDMPPPPARCGVWRWRQRSTLAFGAKSLVLTLSFKQCCENV